jgi:hypothetical protein
LKATPPPPRHEKGYDGNLLDPLTTVTASYIIPGELLSEFIWTNPLMGGIELPPPLSLPWGQIAAGDIIVDIATDSHKAQIKGRGGG